MNAALPKLPELFSNGISLLRKMFLSKLSTLQLGHQSAFD